MNYDELDKDGNELREAEASLVTYVISRLIDMKLYMERSFLHLYSEKHSQKRTLTHDDWVTTMDHKCSYVVEAPARHLIYENFHVKGLKHY